MPQGKLTDKQESFAQAVASGSDQSSAYRQAYNSDGMTDKSVWEKASELRKHVKVSERIKELQAQNEQQEIITRAGIMKDLECIKEQAKQAVSKPILDANGNVVGVQHDSGAARSVLQALDQEAKIIGAYTERRELELTGTIQTTLTLEDKLKIIAEIKNGETD